MREDVRAVIKKAYPTGNYEECHEEHIFGLFDHYLKPGVIEKIVQKCNALQDIEVVLRFDEDYRSDYVLELHTPDSTLHFQMLEVGRHKMRKILKKQGKTLSSMKILISRLGPFYTYHWNVHEDYKGDFVGVYYEAPPNPFWKNVEIDVQKTLAHHRLSRLTDKECDEPVKWLLPGQSLVNDGEVTVYNCLFSEL